MPWAGKNFKEWQLKGLDNFQSATCEDVFEEGLFCTINYFYIFCSVWDAQRDELKCSNAFTNFKYVYVNGTDIPAEEDYAAPVPLCPCGDSNCEDVIQFEFPFFNLLFLG